MVGERAKNEIQIKANKGSCAGGRGVAVEAESKEGESEKMS